MKIWFNTGALIIAISENANMGGETFPKYISLLADGKSLETTLKSDSHLPIRLAIKS
jgi:hypothetical protein